jgi:hypothetical protein
MVGLLRVKRFTLTSWAVAEYLPAVQLTHTLEDILPAEEAAVPAGQLKQARDRVERE